MADDNDYIMGTWSVHRGESIHDVPRKYLQWCLEQDWLDKKKGLEEAIEETFAIRDRSYDEF